MNRAAATSPVGAAIQPGARCPPELTGDAAIAHLSSQQHGVVSLDQLRASGLSRSAVGHRVRQHRLHRLHRRAYAVGHRAVGPHGRVLAAVFALGPGALASHRSAARLLEIAPAGAPSDIGLAPVDVTVVGGRSPAHRDGIRGHTMAGLDPRDLRWVGPIPVTSAARTVLDVTAEEGARAGERMLAEALRHRKATEAEVRSIVTRSFGHHGIGIVAALLDHGPAFDRSVAERMFLELVRRAGLPEPRTNVWGSGFEVDAFWPDFGVVAEFDSFTFHGDVLAFTKDRRKSAALEAAGYDVVPVIWADLHAHPEVVVATVSSVLAIARVRRR